MTNTAISPLRQRMIDDMTVRGFTPSTQRGYLVAVTSFAAFLGRPPDQGKRPVSPTYQQSRFLATLSADSGQIGVRLN